MNNEKKTSGARELDHTKIINDAYFKFCSPSNFPRGGCGDPLKDAFKEGYFVGLEAAQKRIERLEEFVKVFDYAQRTLGYPLPREWNELVKLCSLVLSQEPGERG